MNTLDRARQYLIKTYKPRPDNKDLIDAIDLLYWTGYYAYLDGRCNSGKCALAKFSPALVQPRGWRSDGQLV